MCKLHGMAKRNETGKDGESVARAFLEKQGYKITHTNWHWHHYELDIVAVKDTWLVVVEVKTRSDDYLLAPKMRSMLLKSAVSWRQPMRMSAFSILNYRSVLTS